MLTYFLGYFVYSGFCGLLTVTDTVRRTLGADGTFLGDLKAATLLHLSGGILLPVALALTSFYAIKDTLE